MVPKDKKEKDSTPLAQSNSRVGGCETPEPHEEECALEITNNIFRTVERLFREDQSMIMIEYPGRSQHTQERRYGYDYYSRVVLYSRGDR